MKNHTTAPYKMPDGSIAMIHASRSPHDRYSARLVLANGKTLPISIPHNARSLVEAVRDANKFLRGVYGAQTHHRLHHVSKKTKTKAAPRIAYRLQLTPSDIRAIEFASGRYSWPDMLISHMTDGGLVTFTESEMWQWCDDVDDDTKGGHSPFPLASPALASWLQNFYDERI